MTQALNQTELIEYQLAAQLHREHRAAEKAMNRVKLIWRAGKQVSNPNLLLHDHGWSSCGQKQYFIKRARLILKRSTNRWKAAWRSARLRIEGGFQ